MLKRKYQKPIQYYFNMETQTKLILKHLEAGRAITPIEALQRYNCFRLGARIYDLRRAGYAIGMTLSKGAKKYAIYRLEKVK